MGKLRYGFWFWMDGRLNRLFREAPEVVLSAWAPSRDHVPGRFAFEGDLDGYASGWVTLTYSQCGFEGYHAHPEGRLYVKVGEVAIRGLALKAICNFLDVAGGATGVYVGVLMGLAPEPRLEEVGEVLVLELELALRISGPGGEGADLRIRGLRDFSVLEARVFTPLDASDAWRIYPDGDAHYIGLRKEEEAKMPEWLERALKQ